MRPRARRTSEDTCPAHVLPPSTPPVVRGPIIPAHAPADVPRHAACASAPAAARPSAATRAPPDAPPAAAARSHPSAPPHRALPTAPARDCARICQCASLASVRAPVMARVRLQHPTCHCAPTRLGAHSSVRADPKPPLAVLAYFMIPKPSPPFSGGKVFAIMGMSESRGTVAR